jgi:hypothetical protein
MKNFAIVLIILLSFLSSYSKTILEYERYINSLDSTNWDVFSSILSSNSNYDEMQTEDKFTNEKGNMFGVITVYLSLIRIYEISWSENDKKNISSFLKDYYLNYTSNLSFIKDKEALYIDLNSFNEQTAKVENKKLLINRINDGLEFKWQMLIPIKILRIVLKLDPIQAYPIIEEYYIFYNNGKLNNSVYYNVFKNMVIHYLLYNIETTSERYQKQAFFDMIKNIFNKINDPSNKSTLKQEFNHFLQVKELFEINDQKKAWEHLSSQDEVLKNSTELGYDDFYKINFISYNKMRDAYYYIDDDILLELEEKATGNKKDYYTMNLIKFLSLYDYYDKERKLPEAKYERFKKVITDFAERIKDPKMKRTCENALKNAKNNMK